MDQTFNAAAYLVDRQVESGGGDRTAVRCGDRVLTYAQLLDLSCRVAGGYRALDLRREERVLLVMSDGPELLAAILGAFRLGAVAVPVSTMLTGPELGKIVADSGARALVITAEFGAAASYAVGVSPELRHVVVVGDAQVAVAAGVHLVGWDALVANEPVQQPVTTLADAPALWLYTSGTTGTPKAAMHRHANIRHVVETYGAQVLDIAPDDVCFSVAKLFFAYGLGNSALFPLAVGATTVLEPRRPTPDVVAERLVKDRPTLFFGVPTFYAALLAAELPADTFSSVRMCVSAGESLPAALYTRFTERYGVDILDGIGSTEALHIFLSNRPGSVRAGTTGVAVPGYDLELRDETGAPVPIGTPGALFVSGESLATGYWCRTDATRTAFQGTWLRTGDTYVQSDDGYYTCLGRSDDLLKAGGIWVSPAEVEDRLLRHPGVAEVAVVGERDEDGLDKPVAYVVAVPGSAVDPAELDAFCRDGLAAFKRPRRIVVVDDLPKTPTGKLQRYKLRQQAIPMAVPTSVPTSVPARGV